MRVDGNSSIGEQMRSVRAEASDLRSEAAGIAADVQRLLKLEGELAQAEAQEAAGFATRAVAFGAAAGVVAFIGAIFLFASLMYALDTATPLWLAALITTGVALLLAGILAMVARGQMKKFSPTPKRFIRTMREDMEWVKTQIKSNAR